MATVSEPGFPVSKTEVTRLVSAPFRVERAAPPLRSPAKRRGEEWMMLARKPDAAG